MCKRLTSKTCGVGGASDKAGKYMDATLCLQFDLSIDLLSTPSYMEELPPGLEAWLTRPPCVITVVCHFACRYHEHRICTAVERKAPTPGQLSAYATSA